MVGLTPEDRLARTSQEPIPPGKPPKPPRRRGPHWGLRVVGLIFGSVLGVIMLVVIVGGFVTWQLYLRYSADLPSLDTLRNYQPEVMSRVYAGNSQLISELASERRIYVPLSAIPTQVQQAFISAEDQNFWTNPGIDPGAMARAAITDVLHYGSGRRPIGASTITQQLARNILLDDAPTLSRKVRELILAVRIEQSMSKQQILETYLNEIPLGLSSYGVAAAAQAYFNKSLDDLTLPEAAFLAVLPKAPAHYNPFKFPAAAKARRDWVLQRMAEDRTISADDAAAAIATPINAAPFRRPDEVVGAEWFGEEVRRELVATYGKDVLTGGYIVRTSLDPSLQGYADTALRNGLMAYDRKHGGWRGPVAHIDTGALFSNDWISSLSSVQKPVGMLNNWVLATVIEESDDSATLGYLEVPAGALPSAAVAQTLPMYLADAKWARPALKGGLGPVPRRMSDVVSPGDVVMAEVVPETNGDTPSPAHLILRQIPKVQGALISLDPSTGRVLALSGGWSFAQSQFDRATQANRQPGSSFKPFVYLAALEHGISPSQQFLDAPVVISMGPGQPPWRPNNYELTFNGPTPLRVALEQSLNLVTIHVAETIGLPAVAATAEAFRVVDHMPLVPSAALGAIETTVLRQAGAYASLAAGGKAVTPTLIDSVQDRAGHVIERPMGVDCDNCSDPSQQPHINDQRMQIADPQSVYQLIGMMEGVITRPHGTGYLAGVGMADRELAGKTGTTEEFNDAWFGGFTPDLVTMVWVGYDNPASLGEKETGGQIAAPIWHDFMFQALQTRPKLQFRMPSGLTLADWDTGNGSVADAFRPNQVPGASSDELAVANSPMADPNATPVAATGAPGSPVTPPAANPADIDKSLGTLY